eukprot:jgi/Botrbrau1/15588/Bobra.0246s0002.1
MLGRKLILTTKSNHYLKLLALRLYRPGLGQYGSPCGTYIRHSFPFCLQLFHWPCNGGFLLSNVSVSGAGCRRWEERDVGVNGSQHLCSVTRVRRL